MLAEVASVRGGGRVVGWELIVPSSTVERTGARVEAVAHATVQMGGQDSSANFDVVPSVVTCMALSATATMVGAFVSATLQLAIAFILLGLMHVIEHARILAYSILV